MARPKGTCRLCRKDALLAHSHIVPSWAYELVQKQYNSAVRDLVRATPDGQFYTQQHVKDYLLCDDCEQLFSRHENVVRNLARQPDDTFPFLLKALDKPLRDTLSHFGLSVFFRGSVTGLLPSMQLGDAEEPVRRFLLGDKAPTDGDLAVHRIDETTSWARLFSMPTSFSEADDQWAAFLMHGIAFSWWSGPQRPISLIEEGFLHGAKPSVTLLPNEDVEALLSTALSSKVRGRLKNLARPA